MRGMWMRFYEISLFIAAPRRRASRVAVFRAAGVRTMGLVMGVTTESGASPLTANPLAPGIEKLKLQT